MTKCALICGAGGFIVDLKFHEFSETKADDFVVGDRRDQGFCRAMTEPLTALKSQIAHNRSRGLQMRDVHIQVDPVYCLEPEA
jgi:hypothetical protein